MINTINAGVIGCDMSEDFFQTIGSNGAEKYSWKKAFPADKTLNRITYNNFPIEIVDSVEAIANDEEITLVIVSSNNIFLARPIIAAGKSVRII